MKKMLFASVFLLLSHSTWAAVPIEGLYIEAFGGWTYLPDNINTIRDTFHFHNTRYQSGYNYGGKIGYKCAPFRFDAELSYLTAKVNRFQINTLQALHPNGNTQAGLGFVSAYYDFSDLSPVLEPYVGLGVGGAWVRSRLYNELPFTPLVFKSNNGVFAYHGTIGITYNFSENYALDASYRYIGTTQADQFGKSLQAHQLSAGIIYRFDEATYK